MAGSTAQQSVSGPGSATEMVVGSGVGSGVCVSIGGRTSSLLETTKPRIVQLVTITSMVGFAMAAVSRPWETWTNLLATAFACAVGTALSAAGANSINQWMERDRDGLMRRTQRRPLPQGRASPRTVLMAGVSLSIIGVALLWIVNGAAPAAISLTCVLVYVALYTPMKPRTTLSTYVGAIPGALPPLIGWTAASSVPGFRSLLEPGGISLFLLMFAWQIPHFMAIAWMYREDYAAGGYRVLPVLDESGARTARAVALWTAALVPLTLAPAWAMPDRLGVVYIAVAGSTGLCFAWLAWRLIQRKTRESARAVFFGSIIHLPVLMVAMTAEAIVRVMM